MFLKEIFKQGYEGSFFGNIRRMNFVVYLVVCHLWCHRVRLLGQQSPETTQQVNYRCTSEYLRCSLYLINLDGLRVFFFMRCG